MRKNLINARKNKKLTQFQMANNIGLSERQYQRLEAGTSNGNMNTWNKLKILLGEDIDSLVEKEI